MLCGSTSNLNFPNMVLIPESMAIRFYGQIDVIGKSVTTENTTYTIGGVYKDFPKTLNLKIIYLHNYLKKKIKTNGETGIIIAIFV